MEINLTEHWDPRVEKSHISTGQAPAPGYAPIGPLVEEVRVITIVIEKSLQAINLERVIALTYYSE
jgi:hypothetical protein